MLRGQEWKTLSGAGYQVTEGQEEIMTIQLHDKSQVSYFAGVLARNLRSGYITLNIRATMQVASKEWEPDITWLRTAPLTKMKETKHRQNVLSREVRKKSGRMGKRTRFIRRAGLTGTRILLSLQILVPASP